MGGTGIGPEYRRRRGFCLRLQFHGRDWLLLVISEGGQKLRGSLAEHLHRLSRLGNEDTPLEVPALVMMTLVLTVTASLAERQQVQANTINHRHSNFLIFSYSFFSSSNPANIFVAKLFI
jgi:hypothetical protein